MLGQTLVAAEFGAGEGLTQMASAHDAVGDAAKRQFLAPFFAVIGFVGIDHFLVSTNQLIGGLALIDVGWGDGQAADNPALLVHRRVQLVAEIILALLLGPGRIGIKFAANELAGRPARSIGW